MSTLLIVDDEPNILYSLQKSLRGNGLLVETAETGQQGLDAVRKLEPDIVLMDVRLPDMSGLETFQQMREIDGRLPVIIMTAYSTTDLAIEATRRGAFDFLVKPVELSDLRRVINQAMELSRLSRVPAVIQEEASEQTQADRIVGQSPAMQHVYKQIGRVADQDVNVLIVGESGTGKELCARAIYQHGCRAQGPFVAINAAAIPEPLLESELFGHERGAFTGADRRRIGKLEQANGGTVFLDEIGDMPVSLQAKLLRVLQDGCFTRIGSNETIHTDVRVIAATNKDLEKLIADGAFRQDLFYRLNGFSISLPPLRHRLEDLPLLVDHYVKRFNDELRRNVTTPSAGIMQMLADYNWPGNIRELQTAIRFAFVNASGDVLTAECFPQACRQACYEFSAKLPDTSLSGWVETLVQSGESELFNKVHDEVDRKLLAAAMRHVGGNQRAAARLLGISRTTLRARLQSLDIDHERD